jgi:hypothetical protein
MLKLLSLRSFSAHLSNGCYQSVRFLFSGWADRSSSAADGLAYVGVRPCEGSSDAGGNDDCYIRAFQEALHSLRLAYAVALNKFSR